MRVREVPDDAIRAAPILPLLPIPFSMPPAAGRGRTLSGAGFRVQQCAPSGPVGPYDNGRLAD